MVFSSQSNLLFFKRRFPNLLKLFSSSPSPSPPPPPPKPTSLSARMSFVFDQIDAIKREQGDKDQTLQRIRAWRESKQQNALNKDAQIPQNAQKAETVMVVEKEGRGVEKGENGEVGRGKDLVLTHPWPEWMELIERLVKQNYFDSRRSNEEGMLENAGFRLDEMIEEGKGDGEGEGEEGLTGNDFSDWNTVETAVLNFGRDRFDILRLLPRKDLQILVGYGCPITEKKTAFSAKVLRKYVHLDEGDVCSTCSLRTSCKNGYIVPTKEEEARTVDVMRILLTYGFDPINGPVMNKSLLKSKSVKSVIRKLIHEVVKLSAVPIDPNLPPPVFKKPPPKVKQPPTTPRRRVGRDDIEMKQGDWLCVKCDFMNFAKNTICLQCDAKRPKRQLLPGEWECPQCNFLNYRRNVVCFHCECKRPQDEYMESQIPEKQAGPGMRTTKVSSREEINNSWNFNFDDDESDGADVAAFEYADSNKLNEDSEDGYDKSGQMRMHARITSPSIAVDPAAGFNDFSDDDDVDNYELDNRNEAERASRVDFSKLEAESDSENGKSSRQDRRRTSLHDREKPARPGNPRFGRPKEAELDFGSDDDLPIHPQWQSSHIANPRQSNRHGGAVSNDSDDDLGSDGDDKRTGGGFSSGRMVRGRQIGNRNRSSPNLESDDDQDFHGGKRTGPGSRDGYSRGGRGSNDRRGDSQSFSGGRARSGRSAEPDSYYDQERFKKPRVNVR